MPPKLKSKTKTIEDNGFNPVWNERLTFTFETAAEGLLDLAFLRFDVRCEGGIVDAMDRSIGTYTISLGCLNQDEFDAWEGGQLTGPSTDRLLSSKLPACPAPGPAPQSVPLLLPLCPSQPHVGARHLIRQPSSFISPTLSCLSSRITTRSPFSIFTNQIAYNCAQTWTRLFICFLNTVIAERRLSRCPTPTARAAGSATSPMRIACSLNPSRGLQ